MPMYNLINYSDNYSKTSWSLWQYCRDEPFLDVKGDIGGFPVKNSRQNTKLCHKNVKIIVPLKYLSNFWRTLEMPLINCEINLILTWFANSFIIDAQVNNQVLAFAITDTRLYVPVVTLSTQDNAKLLQ